MDNCPISGNEVNIKKYSAVLDGVFYVFCCKKCKENFIVEPRKYINCCEESKEKEK